MSIKRLVLKLERFMLPQTGERGCYRRQAMAVLSFALVAIVLAWGDLTPLRWSGADGVRSDIALRDAVLTAIDPHEAANSWSAPAADKGTPVTLPHRLERGPLRSVNYRLVLNVPPLSASAAPWALCVPRWSSSAAVWLNGELLRQPAPATLGLTDMQRPALVMLPPRLAPGSYALDIRLRAVPGAISGLSTVWLGDSTQLRHSCLAAYERSARSNVGNVYIMIFMGLIALAISVLQRDRMALYFALMAAAWCAHHLFVQSRWTDVDETTWLAVFYVTRPLAVLPLSLFVLSYIGQARPGLRSGLLLLFAAAYAIFAVLPAMYWPLWIAIFALILLLIMLVLLYEMVRYSVQQAAFSVVIFCAALVLAIVFNLLDIARTLEWLDGPDRSPTYLAVPLLALGMGALILERLVNYMGTEERSARALREEVARQRAQLAQDYLKLQAQAEKIAVLEERKRIVRDMHDGLGTQLVSAGALLRSSHGPTKPLAALIDSALYELRSVLDVLSVTAEVDDPEDDPVSLLLGKLRHRLGPVLRAQGIEIVWQTECLPPGFLACDRMRLQLLRILQEAFTNVLKHSQARTVYFTTQVFNDRVVFDLRDDGQGFDTERANNPPSGGHGLANMRQRAQDIGAHLTITRLHPGTSVQLVFDWPATPNALFSRSPTPISP